ncbi:MULTISPECIES: iron ABC transporter permease [Thermoactinomyces]|uniref:Iron ABC transporter permease n=1 Tax=Thermoactinomyces daqus TaxID=1329516 RepID=A0A7W1X8Q8_9BACL|nr:MULTISPECIES: iron ABC transporter permease [Thermoactinomyces]MBA4542123.1 iron ABC transporter permease [Thermoactinomyces daqus]MBH8608332.1 iron ABC transporter permease [Thermoactinomyces sp. CICC 10521]
MKRYTSLRLGSRFSALIDWRAVSILFLLAAFAFLVMVLSVGVGQVQLSPLDVIRVFLGIGSKFDQLIVETFRLPRILLALIAGASLAVSGAFLQAVIRNPLASPDMVGVTGGASVGAVTVITFFSDRSTNLSVSLFWVPAASFIGAAVIVGLLLFFSWGKISPFRLVLLGIGFTLATQAATNFIILIGPPFSALQAKTWLTGSIYGSNWNQVAVLLPWLALLLPLAFVFSRHLNVSQMGDSLATALGARPSLQRLLVLLIATALAGAAVSFVGTIGFVGLIAPHAARKLVGAAYGLLLPASALLGAIMVMGADLLGRTLFAPLEVPAGVLIAVIGAPYFLFLLYWSRKK